MGKDDVCLAYNGQNPGPPGVFEESDSVEITLVFNVERGFQGLGVDKGLAGRLNNARYSF